MSAFLIAQVKVTVKNEQTGLTRTVETNEEGIYRVPFLPVGSYSVRVEKAEGTVPGAGTDEEANR